MTGYIKDDLSKIQQLTELNRPNKLLLLNCNYYLIVNSQNVLYSVFCGP